MPSKKKSKPSFNVPDELQTAPQAGWVYRSEAQSSTEAALKSPRRRPAETGTEAAPASTPAGKSVTPIPSPQPSPTPPAATPAAALENARETKGKRPQATTAKSNGGILDLAARTISSSFEAMSNAVLLTTRIITAPISMGMKMLGLK